MNCLCYHAECVSPGYDGLNFISCNIQISDHQNNPGRALLCWRYFQNPSIINAVNAVIQELIFIFKLNTT